MRRDEIRRAQSDPIAVLRIALHATGRERDFQRQ